MMFFTLVSGFTPFCTPWETMLDEILMVTSLAPAATTFSLSLAASAAREPLAG